MYSEDINSFGGVSSQNELAEEAKSIKGKVLHVNDAAEYLATSFGKVVQFEDVEKDKEAFAKVFAQGSPALEKLLLNVWDRGVQTSSCGTNHNMDVRSDVYAENERFVLEEYQKYSKAKGFKKLSMFFERDKYIPTHDAYICFDTSAMPEHNEFANNVEKAMKKHKECQFSILERPLKDGSPSLSFYFKVSREDKCKGLDPENMTQQELVESFRSPPEMFDKYFDIVNDEFNKHLDKYVGRADIQPQISSVANSESFLMCEAPTPQPEQRHAPLCDVIALAAKQSESVTTIPQREAPTHHR